jgi:hypothetical protein
VPGFARLSVIQIADQLDPLAWERLLGDIIDRETEDRRLSGPDPVAFLGRAARAAHSARLANVLRRGHAVARPATRVCEGQAKVWNRTREIWLSGILDPMGMRRGNCTGRQSVNASVASIGAVVNPTPMEPHDAQAETAPRLEDLRTPEGEAIPPNTLAELQRDFGRRRLVLDQLEEIEKARLERLKKAPKTAANAMVPLLARIIGVGVETADILVQEILSRNLRDLRAVARYAGLTGSPNESGNKRREKGLARSGNSRVRRGMVLLAWRFLHFQKDSALVRWFYARTGKAPGLRKKMIVAMARKLLIALWQFVRHGVMPEGDILRPAH